MPINKVTDKSGKPVKKDGKQKYRVRVNYTDSYGNNKQIERTAYGADEAKQLERELTHSVKTEQPSAKLTVRQLFDEYVTSKKHEVRESTLAKSKQVLELHILPFFEDIKIDKINVPLIEKWKQSVNDGNYKITTKQNFYKEFRSMLNYAVKMEYLPHNPLLKAGNFKAPLEDVEEMDFYTPEEFKKFIDVAKQIAEESTHLQDWNLYVFFCIAFFMGMRKGEINALNWCDIQNGDIKITKSLNQKLKGCDRITPPKNKSSIRTIQIQTPLKEILDEHYSRCKTMPNFSDSYYVCGGTVALRDTTIATANEKYAQLAGIKKIRIHDFRHSHASYLANNGINIQEIARRLGHADISITLKTYSHLYPKESERALTLLNQIDI